MDAFHQQMAAALPDVSQSPGNQRDRAGRQRLDHALLRLCGHQRNISIEDRRAHWIGGRPYAHLSARHRTPRIALHVPGDPQGSCRRHRALPDRAPRLLVRPPGTRRRLFRGQLGRLIGGRNAPRIDRPHPHTLAAGLHADRWTPVRENRFHRPRSRARSAIAPEHERRGKFGRKYRPLGRVVHNDRGGLPRALSHHREHEGRHNKHTAPNAHKAINQPDAPLSQSGTGLPACPIR